MLDGRQAIFLVRMCGFVAAFSNFAFGETYSIEGQLTYQFHNVSSNAVVQLENLARQRGRPNLNTRTQAYLSSPRPRFFRVEIDELSRWKISVDMPEHPETGLFVSQFDNTNLMSYNLPPTESTNSSYLIVERESVPRSTGTEGRQVLWLGLASGNYFKSNSNLEIPWFTKRAGTNLNTRTTPTVRDLTTFQIQTHKDSPFLPVKVYFGDRLGAQVTNIINLSEKPWHRAEFTATDFTNSANFSFPARFSYELYGRGKSGAEVVQITVSAVVTNFTVGTRPIDLAIPAFMTIGDHRSPGPILPYAIRDGVLPPEDHATVLTARKRAMEVIRQREEIARQKQWMQSSPRRVVQIVIVFSVLLPPAYLTYKARKQYTKRVNRKKSI